MLPSTDSARRLVIATLLVTGLPHPAGAQEEWPGFRGASGSAVSDAGLNVSTLAPEVLWRVTVGSGYSGATVADGRVLTMFQADDHGGQYMLALDAETGDELWRRWIAEPYLGHDGSWDGPISTPVVHGGVVVGLEPRGNLFALDVIAGEPMWSVDLVEDMQASRPLYGFASSPTVVGDTLVVNGGGPAGTVIGFDLQTGELRWQVGTETAAAQSPVQMTVQGRELIVAAGAESVFGIDAATGEIFWQYAHGGGGVRGADSMVPVAAGTNRVLLTHSGDASQLVTVSPGAGGLVGERTWEERTLRSSYVPVVYHGGYVYGYNLRILVCVDAATGELMWRSRAPGDGFPTIVGNHLLVLTKDGTLHVARATPEGYEELVGAPIFDELTWSPPSIAYGDVFARSRNQVARIDLNGAGSRNVAASDLNVPRSLDPGDGEFGRLIRAAEGAEDAASLIDDFFAGQTEFPLREGASRVHFVYRGEARDMAITGDMLGTRQDVPMARVAGTDLYYYTAELLPEARLSYAFLRDGEMITDPLNPLIVPTLIYNAEREHVFGDRPLPMSELRMPRWRLAAHLREPAADSRGSVETLGFENRRGEFEVQVYLPRGYAESSARYPVVYFHGPAPTDLSEIPTSLDNLIADGMSPVIAVWTGVRLGAGEAYVEFWADELVATVDRRFRTIASADGRVSVGGGLGALAALRVAVAYPEMTSGLALLSIRALDLDWEPLLPMVGTPESRPLRLYVGWGAYGVRNPQEVWDNRLKTAQRARQLRDLGYEVAGGEAPDGVGWASWRNRTDAILRSILPPPGDE